MTYKYNPFWQQRIRETVRHALNVHPRLTALRVDLRLPDVPAATDAAVISISKLALENGINANLLFKWRQQWREGKLLLPSSESPQLLPVTLDAAAEQPESLAEDPETLSISCEVTFRHGTLRFNGNVSEKLLTLLIQELKR